MSWYITLLSVTAFSTPDDSRLTHATPLSGKIFDPNPSNTQSICTLDMKLDPFQKVSKVTNRSCKHDHAPCGDNLSSCASTRRFAHVCPF